MQDNLGTRMKTYYEQIPKTRLMRRVPVAVRLDGKSFHTFTKGFERPFDKTLHYAMHQTMLHLCENIQGCVFAYTQSDEITLILIDYQTLDTSAFFDYEVQKLCSITASMTTLYFNQEFEKAYLDLVADTNGEVSPSILAKDQARRKGAMFDSRCFNIPKEEVANLLYWRQLDATRNSIQMVGQANFSHKELQNKSCNDIQNMLLMQRDINWNNFSAGFKRGTACYKNEDNKWVIDLNTPIFKDDWNYINKHIYIGE